MLVCAAFCGSACGGESEPPPSCFQAMSAYYDTGCSFVNLTTGQQITQAQATSDCQTEAARSVSVSCDVALDEWLTCLYETSPALQCDCSQEHMEWLRC